MSKPLAAPVTLPQSSSAVLLPAAVDKPFTYRTPEGLAPGSLVVAPLMGRKLVGAVWDTGHQSPVTSHQISEHKLKPIESILDFPPLKPSYMKWLDWVADFTLAPKGAVLALAAISLAAKTPRKPYAAPEYKVNLPSLTETQAQAVAAIKEWCVDRDKSDVCVDKKPILLDGVTGSGKTEVYFHAIAEILKNTHHAPRTTHHSNQQVLVLLPEIALTHQWFERFTKAFGAPPTVWHSAESPAARTRVWQAVARGEAKVVVGARSALFLPFKNLSLIVVDEEHDPTYKQDDGVLYHARDMAVARAKFENIPVVLASATPSLETLHNVAEGRYRSFHLPERFGAAGMPDVKIVDMLTTPPERGEFLAAPIKEKMLETLAKGQQTLLFLNRRGYAPLLLCRGCGHRFECPHCSAWLVVHGKGGFGVQDSGFREKAHLSCHHCDHREPIPAECPKCQAKQEKLAPCGPGVERIADEVRAMFGIVDIPSPLRGGSGRGAGSMRAHIPLAQAELTQDHAQALRLQSTDAEKKLWEILRDQQMEGCKFRRQVPLDRYIADFACLDKKLIIELDGGQHTPQRDAGRTRYIESQGFHILRFWNHDVLENIEGVTATILAQLRPPIQPSPARGEGFKPTIAILSSDESVAAEIWAAIERGEVDILIGTQMAAKGHHFPNLTFVAVVDADLGLEGTDLRTSERTFQLLHQLGGRAGRETERGEVLIQTFQPSHPVMQALVAHDRDRIMALELLARKAGNWPPFGQLAAILLDGVDEQKVRRAGQLLAQSAPHDPRITVLGPAPAPLSKLRDQYRYRLLIKAQKGIHLQRTLKGWLEGKKFQGVRVKLDVNPYYFQ